MSLSLIISYFICLKASNQSDLMQYNVPAAIFHMAQYSVRGVWLARSVRRVFRACRFSLTLCHTERAVAKHNNMGYARQHRVRSARLPRFGEMFQWRKSLVCCFGALICILRAPPSFLLSPNAPPFFVLVPQQMAAVNFGNFLV